MTTPVIAQELGLIKGIKIFGKPQVSVVAFGSDETNVFGISDTLKNKVFNENFSYWLLSAVVALIQYNTILLQAILCVAGLELEQSSIPFMYSLVRDNASHWVWSGR